MAHKKTDREKIIDDIQELRDQYVGTSWQKFSAVIYSACRQEYRKLNGQPLARWLNVANDYLSDLKKAQEFSGKTYEA